MNKKLDIAIISRSSASYCLFEEIFHILQGSSITCRKYESFEEASDAWLSKRPDLITLTRFHPVNYVLDCIDEIKSQALLSKIPLLVELRQDKHLKLNHLYNYPDIEIVRSPLAYTDTFIRCRTLIELIKLQAQFNEQQRENKKLREWLKESQLTQKDNEY